MRGMDETDEDQILTIRRFHRTSPEFLRLGFNHALAGGILPGVSEVIPILHILPSGATEAAHIIF